MYDYNSVKLSQSFCLRIHQLTNQLGEPQVRSLLKICFNIISCVIQGHIASTVSGINLILSRHRKSNLSQTSDPFPEGNGANDINDINEAGYEGANELLNGVSSGGEGEEGI